VTGFTYNLLNPSTGYQNGIDWHLDWGGVARAGVGGASHDVGTEPGNFFSHKILP